MNPCIPHNQEPGTTHRCNAPCPLLLPRSFPYSLSLLARTRAHIRNSSAHLSRVVNFASVATSVSLARLRPHMPAIRTLSRRPKRHNPTLGWCVCVCVWRGGGDRDKPGNRHTHTCNNGTMGTTHALPTTTTIITRRVISNTTQVKSFKEGHLHLLPRY